MRDRLVNRETKVCRIEHEVVPPDIDRLGRELLHGFFRPARRVLDELGVDHVFVATPHRRDVGRLARLEVREVGRHRRSPSSSATHGRWSER
jgi:hypothetical protein